MTPSGLGRLIPCGHSTLAWLAGFFASPCHLIREPEPAIFTRGLKRLTRPPHDERRKTDSLFVGSLSYYPLPATQEPDRRSRFSPQAIRTNEGYSPLASVPEAPRCVRRNGRLPRSQPCPSVACFCPTSFGSFCSVEWCANTCLLCYHQVDDSSFESHVKKGRRNSTRRTLASELLALFRPFDV